MSAQVEERIVGLRFDNKEFEKGVGQSIKTLDKLDFTLGNTFRKGADTVTLFASKIKGITLDPIAKGAEMSIGKLMALTAALTGVHNVADEVYRKTTSLIKSMSADQVAAGWSKYDNYTQSMQTILAATKKDTETDVQAMERVNEQMDKLLWFSDETSYSFTDMTNNIGKFTSQGVELETSVKAMQGISLWAAAAGQDTNAASRAMYNLSQSLGMGSVRLQDWMSVENANMATKEVKEMLLEAGVLEKTLRKVGDAYQVIATGEEVSVEKFRDSLKDGWLTTEVLLDTTQQYNEFAELVYKRVKETGELTSSVIQELKDNGTAAKFPIAARAMEMAQAAITFKQAVESVQDAVSTQFMRIWQAIFGNYLQAKDLWTTLAEELWDVFAYPLNVLAQALERFNKLGNMDKIIRDLWSVWNDLLDIMNAVKDAFYEVIGFVYDEESEDYDKSIIGRLIFGLNILKNKLHDAVVEFNTFTRRLMENNELWENVSTFFGGIKSAGNIVKSLFDTIYNKIIVNVLGETGTFIDLLGKVLRKIGEILQKADQFVQDTDFFNTTFDNIVLFLNNIKKIIDKIGESAKKIFNTIAVQWERLSRSWSRTKGGSSKAGMPSFLTAAEDGVKNFSVTLNNLTDLAVTTIDATTTALNGAVPVLVKIVLQVKRFFNDIKTAFENIKKWIENFGKTMAGVLAKIFGANSVALQKWLDSFNFIDLINNSKNIIDFVKNLTEKIKELYEILFSKSATDAHAKGGGQGIINPTKKTISKMIAERILTIMEDFEPVVKKINEWSGQNNLVSTVYAWLKAMNAMLPMMVVGILGAIALLVTISYEIRKFRAQAVSIEKDGDFITGNFFEDLSNIPTNFQRVLKSVAELKDPLINHLRNIKQIVNKLFVVGMVFLIIKAIAIQSLSMLILSFIPWGKLLYISLVALPIMVGLVIGSIVAMNKMVNVMEKEGKGNTEKVVQLGKYMVNFAKSFLLMAAAMAIISSIDWADENMVKNMTASMWGIGLALFAMVTVVTILANQIKENDSAAGIIEATGGLILKMGISILLIAFAMSKIAQVDPDRLTQSMIVIDSLIAIFGVIVFLVENTGMDENVEKAIIALGAMCLMMAGSLLMACGAMVLIAKKLSEEELTRSAIVIGVMYVLLASFLAGSTILSNWMAKNSDTFKNFIALGAMVLTLSTAILILAAAMKTIVGSGADLGAMAAVTGMMIVFLANIGAILSVGTFIIEKFGNFGTLIAFGSIVGGILTSLSIMMVAFAAMELDDAKVGRLWAVVGAMTVLVAAITAIIGLASYLLSNQYGAIAMGIGAILGMIIGGLGMLLVGIGLILYSISELIKSMVILSEMEDEGGSKLKNLGKNLGAAFEAFVLSIRDLVGMIVANIISNISNAIDKITDSGILGKLKVFLTKLTHTIAAYIEDNHEVIKQSIIYVVEDFIDIVTEVVNTKGPGVLDALFNFIKDLLRHIKDLADNDGQDTINSVLNMVDAALATLFVTLEKYSIRLNGLFLSTGLGLVATWNIIKLALITGIFTTITYILTRLMISAGEFGATAAIIMINFFNGFMIGIALHAPILIASLVALVIDIINTFSESIEDNEDEITDAGDSLLNTLANALVSWVNKNSQPGGRLYNSGWNIVRGIMKGIISGIPLLNSVIDRLGSKGIEDPFDKRMGINSPSTVMKEKGGYLIEGLVGGIADKAKSTLPNVMSDLGTMVLGQFTNSFGNPMDLLTNWGSGMLEGLTSEIGFDLNSLMGQFTDFSAVITPTLDTSVLESQLGGIQSMFGQEQIEAISGSFSAPDLGMDSVTMQSNFDSMMSKMQDYMDVQNYNSANAKTNVNVILDGDAKKMLKVLKVENLKQTKATGVNQLVTK